jgi:hypothetical protein
VLRHLYRNQHCCDHDTSARFLSLPFLEKSFVFYFFEGFTRQLHSYRPPPTKAFYKCRRFWEVPHFSESMGPGKNKNQKKKYVNLEKTLYKIYTQRYMCAVHPIESCKGLQQPHPFQSRYVHPVDRSLLASAFVILSDRYLN